MRNSKCLKNNNILNIQPRPQEQLKAQHSARQTFERGKSTQHKQNSRPPSRNPSQTNQSDSDKEISYL